MAGTTFQGRLEYLGWQLPWFIDGARDASADFWRVADRLRDRPAALSYGGEEMALAPDPSSDMTVKFETPGGGIILSAPSGPMKLTNLMSYFDAMLCRLNGRVVSVTSDEAGDSFAIAAADDGAVHSVRYKTPGNMARVLPGDETKVCKVGNGAETCIFLVAGASGLECAKFSSLAGVLLERHARGEMNAGRIGDCRVSGREPEPVAPGRA